MKFNFKKALAVFLSLSFLTLSVSAAGIKTGSPAPDFSLKLTDGTNIKLSDYRGKAVLLHFWATWCPPCRIELPGMDAFAKKIADQGEDAKIVFLAVCISDTEENRAAFMETNGYTFPGGLDASGKSARLYNVAGIPTSVLIDPEGKIENINVGMMTEEQLADFVKNYAE